MKDKVHFTQQEWNDLVTNGLDGTNVNGRMMQCLARIPNLLQRCKKALSCAPLLESTITELRCEIESLRQDCKAIIAELRDRLDTFNMNPAPITLGAHIYASYLCLCGMGLATGVILNCILDALDDDGIRLCDESSHYSNEIFQLAVSAVKYQPLGSVAMISFLSVAWLGAPDSATKERVKALLSDYGRACLGSSASDLTADLERMATRFTLK